MILFHGSHVPLEIGTLLDPLWKAKQRPEPIIPLRYIFGDMPKMKLRTLEDYSFRELLEYVRRTNFPEKPSLENAVFACRSRAEMEKYNILVLSDSRKYIYRIAPVEDSPNTHVGTWMSYTDMFTTKSGPVSMNSAWEYWHKPHDDFVEVVIGCPCRVVACEAINPAIGAAS